LNRKSIVAGFAIFSMFFGAGNIVLPLYLVQTWPNDVLASFFGFCLTGVFVPLLGLIAAVLTGKVSDYFAPLGVFFAMLIQVVLICIEGPFGVLPRSLIVSNGAFIQEFPNFGGEVFYLIACVILYFLAIKERAMVNIVGKFLTPIMLLFLFILFVLTKPDIVSLTSSVNPRGAFWDGVYKGYLTYDLPAAIYFTSIAMSYFRGFKENSSNADFIKNGLMAGGIAITLLIIVYAAFVYIGLSNYNLIRDILPEQILPTIVKGSLGQYTSLLFTSFILVACLTTAVAAISVWSDFIEKVVFRNKNISRQLILLISLTVSFFVAALQFKGLMLLLQPILQVIYPILIILTIYNIYKNYKNLALSEV
jgi:LIVCS family branched-chain amino acid:cation transporter